MIVLRMLYYRRHAVPWREREALAKAKQRASWERMRADSDRRVGRHGA